MHDGDWAWWIVIPSLALGAVLTGYGLSFDCARADTSCQRSASAAIWGGVGVASLGSLLGVSIVQAGAAQSPNSLSGVQLQISGNLP
jgi:hypothetical protein